MKAITLHRKVIAFILLRVWSYGFDIEKKEVVSYKKTQPLLLYHE